MFKLFTSLSILRFWASPHDSMTMIAEWSVGRTDRQSVAIKAHSPDFAGDDPAEPPSRRVDPNFPTDVPVPEPHDVPARAPIDVPTPDPGEQPPSMPGKDPKPRSVP